LGKTLLLSSSSSSLFVSDHDHHIDHSVTFESYWVGIKNFYPDSGEICLLVSILNCQGIFNEHKLHTGHHNLLSHPRRLGVGFSTREAGVALQSVLNRFVLILITSNEFSTDTFFSTQAGFESRTSHILGRRLTR